MQWKETWNTKLLIKPFRVAGTNIRFCRRVYWLQSSQKTTSQQHFAALKQTGKQWASQGRGQNINALHLWLLTHEQEKETMTDGSEIWKWHAEDCWQGWRTRRQYPNADEIIFPQGDPESSLTITTLYVYTAIAANLQRSPLAALKQHAPRKLLGLVPENTSNTP